MAYRREYGLNGVYLIPANLYGPGDNFDLATSHVIPAIIRKVSEAKKAGADSVTLWGSGRPTRDFLFVDDAADGIVRAAESYDDAEPMNLGPGFERSIANVAKTVAFLYGYRGKIAWDTSHPDGQPQRCLNVRRAWKKMRWRSQWGLDDGLSAAIRWYEESISGLPR